jgi:tRNA (uracil-5-)-methyltransferase
MSGEDGCDKIVQPELYEEHLQQKVAKLRTSLDQYVGHLEVDVYPSPPSHYRLRCRFDIDERDGELMYVMWRYGAAPKRYFTSFPVANDKINALMPKFLAEVKRRPCIANDLVMVHFLSTLSTPDMVVTLV